MDKEHSTHSSVSPQADEVWAVFEDAWEGHGFTQIPNCVMRDSALSMEAKYLYGLLKSYAWEDPESHPGVARLCKNAGVSAPTLGKYMKELDGTLVKVIRRGQGKTNQYRFLSLNRRYGGEVDQGTAERLDPEINTGLNQDINAPLSKQYSGNAYSGDQDVTDAPAREEATSSDNDGLVDALGEYLREKLDGAKPALSTSRLLRYKVDVEQYVEEGLQDGVLYKAMDRIARRWRDSAHYKLSLEQAVEDVIEGKPTAEGKQQGGETTSNVIPIDRERGAARRSKDFEDVMEAEVELDDQKALSYMRDAYERGGPEELERSKALVVKMGVDESDVDAMADEILMGGAADG